MLRRILLYNSSIPFAVSILVDRMFENNILSYLYVGNFYVHLAKDLTI